MALRLAEDHDRIAAGLNDIVVYRLFSAGLDLDAALGLISEHRASAKIQHAISELDLAIRDIRDVVFDHRQSLWSGDLADRGRRVLGPHHKRGSADRLRPATLTRKITHCAAIRRMMKTCPYCARFLCSGSP
jgi:hypothetical protein